MCRNMLSNLGAFSDTGKLFHAGQLLSTVFEALESPPATSQELKVWADLPGIECEITEPQREAIKMAFAFALKEKLLTAHPKVNELMSQIGLAPG